MLNSGPLLGQLRHLFADLFKFLLEDQPTDVHGRVLIQRVRYGCPEVLSAEVEGDLHCFLSRNDSPEGGVEVVVEFLLFLFEYLKLLLFRFAHIIKL
jgi:hypothetical protein